MKEYYPTLLQMPLFEGISAKDMDKLAECLSFRVKHFLKDERLFFEGDEITRIGIVLSGNVIIFKENISGARNIVADIGKGGMFGEAFAFARNSKSTVSVIVSADCDILFVDARKMRTLCHELCPFHNRLIENMLNSIAEKNIVQNEKINLLSKRSTREKLLTFLYRESQRCGSKHFDISFNRQELADYLCVDRSALSSELSKLQKEGLLEYHKNHFFLHDLPKEV